MKLKYILLLLLNTFSVDFVSAGEILNGTYSIEKFMALSDEAKMEMGAKEISFIDFMKSSASGTVKNVHYANLSATFSRSSVSISLKTIVEYTGKTVQWGECEAHGYAVWRGKKFQIPNGLSANYRGGVVTKNEYHSVGCDTNLSGDLFEVIKQNNKILIKSINGKKVYAIELRPNPKFPNIKEKSYEIIDAL